MLHSELVKRAVSIKPSAEDGCMVEGTVSYNIRHQRLMDMYLLDDQYQEYVRKQVDLILSSIHPVDCARLVIDYTRGGPDHYEEHICSIPEPQSVMKAICDVYKMLHNISKNMKPFGSRICVHYASYLRECFPRYSIIQIVNVINERELITEDDLWCHPLIQWLRKHRWTVYSVPTRYNVTFIRNDSNDSEYYVALGGVELPRQAENERLHFTYRPLRPPLSQIIDPIITSEKYHTDDVICLISLS